MDRLKNSGFYTLKFLITPEEFRSALKLLEPAAAQFYQTNFSRTEDTSEQVAEGYRSYYEYFMTAEKREGHCPLFVYAIAVQPGDEQSGYHIKPEDISFPRYGQWAEAMKEQRPAVRISLGAAQDLSHSWMFSKYGLRLQGKWGGITDAQSVEKKSSN